MCVGPLDAHPADAESPTVGPVADGPATDGTAFVKDLAKYEVAAASTAICFFKELRGQLTEEIKTEKRYAAEGGGVINLEKMYELQREIRYVDEATSTVHGELADKGAKPLGCGADLVKKASLCVGYKVMNTFPRGSDGDAVGRFCTSEEMRVLAGSVDLGEKAPFWTGADQAIINLSYELDRAHLVARSAELCIGSRYEAELRAKMKTATAKDRKLADQFGRMLANSRRELGQAALEPLSCDDPTVRQLLTCVIEKHDDVGTKPGCRSPEVKTAMKRLWRE